MAWGLGTLPGFWSHGQTINPDMARVLGPWPWPKPWPKILDIRGCAWGKPVGSRRPGNPRLGDAKVMLTITIPLPYHYHTIMGLSHYPSHGHGRRLAIGLGPSHGPWPRAWLKANGHKLGAMAQDIRYPGVRVGEACGPGVAP